MGIPHPERELERVQKLCQSGLPPVLVLAGPGTWFRERALQAVLAAVPADAELRTVDGQLVEVRGLAADGEGDKADADKADGDRADARDGGADENAAEDDRGGCPDLDVLRGGGLFYTRAFLVVRRAERWLRRYGQALVDCLPKVRRGSGIVLETGKIDKRTKLGRELAQRGAVVEFRDLYDTPWQQPDRPLEGELVQWVVDQSRKLGVLVARESALLLAAQVGKAPGELLAELQRLRDSFGGEGKRKALAPDDLRDLLTCSFESTPFELAEAVLGRDRQRAFRSLRAIFDRGVKSRDGRPMEPAGLFPFATSWLFQSLGQVHEGRLLVDAGARPDDVPSQLGVRSFVERFVEHLRQNTTEQVERGLLALLHCQRLKRCTGESDEVLLERFLVAWFHGGTVPLAPELLEW